ncbi:hypothetical protein BSK59_13810 [Paenibacillus odorifer]|uniref:hypothetical protein n=1 Tax=Paenibacillus odorifer TaxID=189426 RepID=UPI00096D508F|nr:hypothetical protein [Paenibacillus odorifer]OME55547.1 hypothetical protein BSK59_13810 [Paenibacillus odorifer]
MRQRSELYLDIKKRLTYDELNKYLIVYQMSIPLLAKRFSVSSTFIKSHLIDIGYVLEDEKAKYYHKHYHKIKESGTGIKVRPRKARKPFSVIR